MRVSRRGPNVAQPAGPANTIQCAVMGKKKDRNHAVAPAAKPAGTSKGFNPLIIGAIVIAAVGIGALILSGGTDEAAAPAAQSADANPAAVARAEATAKLGPRKHASLP